MGKPKNKKKGQDDISDEDIASDSKTKDMGEEDPTAAAPSKGKKKEKKKKRRDEDWEEDVTKELEQMSLDVNKGLKEEEEEEDIPQPAKKTKKKKKKNDPEDEDEEEDAPKSKAKPTFQMLMMEDEDDNEENDQDNKDDDSDSKPAEIVLETVKEAAGSKKKDKKAKKKEKVKTKEEEDIDAILAALDAPVEKKKGKKKQAEESKEASPEQEAPVTEKASTSAPEEAEVKENGTASEMAKEAEEGEEEGDEEGGSTVKTAAQKRKEKKEREKQKKLKEKQKGKKQGEKAAGEEGEGQGQASAAEAAGVAGEEDAAAAKPQDEEGEEEESTSKKKKKKGEKEEKKEKKPKKQVAAILELQRKMKEEQERLEREEQERIAREEEEQRIADEKRQLEEEKKMKKREKERARKERLKSEGKLLTEKEKQDRRRFNQMLESMKEQGLELPNKEDAPRRKPMYVDKRKKKQQQASEEKTPSPTEEKVVELPVKEAEKEEPVAKAMKVEEENEEEEENEVKDAWDVSEDEEEKAPSKDAVKNGQKTTEAEKDEESDEDNDADDGDDEEEESDEDSDDSDDDDDDRPLEERIREKLLKRHEEAEKKRTTDILRAPVVCVLGHVDTGKTKILDKLRQTNVQNAEAGGITQQIGATNVPQDEILKKTYMCKEFTKMELKVPGLLIIDTPGHESFSNLRSRGSSLCDIAILVIDIMHGLEPQTIESIGLLKQKKTPFVVALNKIDRLYQWQSNPKIDVASAVKKQATNTRDEFMKRTTNIIVELAEQGLNAALYYENKNPKEYISLVPTSAHTGDGMGNLVALICELTQTLMAKRLAYSEELHASVMEVKNLQGLGTTIDVILVNGKLNVGDQIVVAGTEGPIVTYIRGLLQPQPMRELRVKNQYVHQKEVLAAQGVKIIAKDMEKAVAGLPLYVPFSHDECEYYKMELEKTLEQVLKSFEVKEKGVYVQASTLGSLEALLEFLRTSKISYSGINIGDVHKRDVTKACAMLQHDKMFAVILAFDVKVEREAQELADKEGVIIFTADIIYTLFDRFTEHVDRLKKERQAEFKHLAVYPCKLKILPQHVYKTRDPIVCGVIVEAGSIIDGTPVCVPNREFLDIGRVVGIESNNKPVERATAGMEVCIKIESLPGEAPKMIGRHFEPTDLIVSRISRQSIDVMKNYFRDDMSKADWLLTVELKSMFQII